MCSSVVLHAFIYFFFFFFFFFFCHCLIVISPSFSASEGYALCLWHLLRIIIYTVLYVLQMTF